MLSVLPSLPLPPLALYAVHPARFTSECTVKLGNKELFDKELIGIKEPFPVTNLSFTS